MNQFVMNNKDKAEQFQTGGAHTPGPWRINGYDICAGSYGVAGVYGTTGHAAKEANANAKLIASAPDLLDACKHALFALVGQKKADDGYTVHTVALSKLKAAIKKATV